MKQHLLSAFSVVAVSFSLNAQIVNIPDANFKAYLVANTLINTNIDAEIQVSEATSFTGDIDCSNMSISDLTGIEAFTSLTTLECFNNQITALNVSNNIVLTFLGCNSNLLISLDVSSNTSLSSLNCGNNLLTSIDVSNGVLTDIVCNNNQLTSIDVSGLTTLTYLNCQNNPITNLDVSNNTSLGSLNCMFNQLTNLSLSNSITVLQCTNNQLTSIDVSGNSGLTVLGLANNQLTTLNVKNGNNTNMSNGFFTINNNPNLTCVQVDDAAFSVANWTNIDAGVSFSEDCGLSISNKNYFMEAINIFPNPTIDIINIESDNQIESVTIFNHIGSLVQTESKNTFSVAKLPVGIYTISIKTDKGFSVNKFIKQ
jgi:Leucine-rich repeat (LRR) protein